MQKKVHCARLPNSCWTQQCCSWAMNACFNERMFLSETVQISALKLSHFPDFGLYWLQEKKEMQNQNFRFGFTFHLEKCIHKNIYLESEWTKTDGVWIISPHMFTFLSQDCFIHKSKGSYIMQMLIRKKMQYQVWEPIMCNNTLRATVNCWKKKRWLLPRDAYLLYLWPFCFLY